MAVTKYENADHRMIDPPIVGLDDSFDDIIRTFPESLLNAGDDFVLDPAFSKDPLTPFKAVRDRLGHVVRGENYSFGGVQLPNLFGIDLSRPHYCVMGDAELEEISRDAQRFSNKGAYGAMGDLMGIVGGRKLGTIPTVEDNPIHDELRSLYDTFLNPNAMGERSLKLIRPVCEWLIDRIVAKLGRGEEVCLARDLAVPLTYKAMSTMLGVPQDKLKDFVRLGEVFFTSPLHPELGFKAADDLYGFFADEVAKRKIEPRRDLVTYLINVTKGGERALSDEEVAVTARFILPAGIDTTWRGLSLVLFTLLAHPDQFAQVCANPKELTRRAVEEGIRYSPSGFVAARICAEGKSVGGVDIPAGAHITLLQGVVNRDGRRWSEPDAFDIHRDFRIHRTFNTGIHTCAGQHLARQEMFACVEMIAERLPNLRLAVDPKDVDVRGMQIRSPRKVPVRLA